MGANEPRNISDSRRPVNIPGSRPVGQAARPGGLPPRIPGGPPSVPSQKASFNRSDSPSFGGDENKRHVLVTVSVVMLAVIFSIAVILTPYGELFRATSLRSVVIGLLAFFASTVLHAMYSLDEMSSRSDGSFSEWNFVPRHLVEKVLLLSCWAYGILNLASVMTEVARNLS